MSTFRPRTRRTQTFGLLVAFVGMAFGDSVLADILGRFLFKKPRPGLPGSEILMKLEIDLAEAGRGCPRDIGVSRHEFCTSCAGSGWRMGVTPPSCDVCDGQGEVIGFRRIIPVATICPACAGEAPPITNPCPECQGSGRVLRVASLRVDIPPGVETGMWLQLRNQGELGDRGAPRGNLRIGISVTEHPIYERRKNDLYGKTQVPAATMSEGGDIEVVTLDGPYTLRIPRRTQNGQLLRIKGRGMPDIGGRHRGDLFVEVVLETPGN
jgi:molecular chaperone DnaJ